MNKNLKTIFAIIGSSFVIGVIILGILVNEQQQDKGRHPTQYIHIAADLGYKQVEHRNTTGMTYQIFDTGGMTYYVSESQFNNTPIPQKLDDNLYRMPNGEYLAQLMK